MSPPHVRATGMSKGPVRDMLDAILALNPGATIESRGRHPKAVCPGRKPVCVPSSPGPKNAKRSALNMRTQFRLAGWEVP